MFRNLSFSSIFAISLALVATRSAEAVVLFDTFGPGDTFEPTVGTVIADFQWVAAQFDPVQSAQLTSVEVPLFNDQGAADATVTIYADSAGVPGAILDSATLSGFTDGIVTALMTGGVLLNTGTNYWIGLSANSPNAQAWRFTDPDVAGRRALSNNQGASWVGFDSTETTAFRVNGSVPVPATLALVGLGLAGIGYGRRQFQKA